jgi:hypothetical protein
MSIDVYPPLLDPVWFQKVMEGEVAGHSVVYKFGRNDAVGASYAPISMGAVYRTPQVSAATTVRVKAGNTNDTAAGSGAREITVQGLDETGALVSEALPTAGVSAGAASTTTFLRLFRAWVSESGTYAAATAGSHAADVVIENGAGGTDWLTIDATDFPRGQSEIAVYTVPLGKTAYLYSVDLNVDSTKPASVILFKRQDILQTAPPYSAMRIFTQWDGISGAGSAKPAFPQGPYPALTDIGFMAKAGSPTSIDVEFELLLIDD